MAWKYPTYWIGNLVPYSIPFSDSKASSRAVILFICAVRCFVWFDIWCAYKLLHIHSIAANERWLLLCPFRNDFVLNGVRTFTRHMTRIRINANYHLARYSISFEWPSLVPKGYIPAQSNDSASKAANKNVFTSQLRWPFGQIEQLNNYQLRSKSHQIVAV